MHLHTSNQGGPRNKRGLFLNLAHAPPLIVPDSDSCH